MPPRTDELLAAIKAWCDEERGRRSELARMIGTATQTVTHWFAGRKTPTLEQGLAIQEILKTAGKEKKRKPPGVSPSPTGSSGSDSRKSRGFNSKRVAGFRFSG